MACTGLGRHPRADDADFVDQYCSKIFDAQKILMMSSPTPIIKTAVNAFAGPVRDIAEAASKIAVNNLDFYYGKTQALHEISLTIPERVVMAFIGPSGC